MSLTRNLTEIHWRVDNGNDCFRELSSWWRVKTICTANQWQRFCTSVHCEPTDSHIYLLNSSYHLQHVKNAIPFSQFLRLRRLCSDDSDFNNKCEETCQVFKLRGYPDWPVNSCKQFLEFHVKLFSVNSSLQSFYFTSEIFLMFHKDQCWDRSCQYLHTARTADQASGYRVSHLCW